MDDLSRVRITFEAQCKDTQNCGVQFKGPTRSNNDTNDTNVTFLIILIVNVHLFSGSLNK